MYFVTLQCDGEGCKLPEKDLPTGEDKSGANAIISAGKNAREKGWKITREKGWLCVGCN